VGVNSLLESLPQQVLPAFGIGQVTIDRQHDVVGNKALGRRRSRDCA
jgi:hypothetical protein